MASSFLFDIEPLARFTGINASLRRPKEIICFSYDEEHRFKLDASSLRYYYPPALPSDLNQGFDTFRHLDDTKDEHLNGLIDTMIAYERRTGAQALADIITWRGMMTKIMVAPFSSLDSWEMNATCLQGTIFLEEHHGAKLESRDEQRTQRMPRGAASQDLMSYWGYKFETLSLLPQPWYETSRQYIEGREQQAVSNYAQYCSVVRTGFGKVKMIIGGEVDAVWDAKPEDATQPINWVELKTSSEIHGERDQVKFERKLLKFWAQSFLLGVPKIVVGFRDANGILQRLEELDTQSIPEKVGAHGRGLWDGQTCINFAAQFLDWIKNTITEGGVWRIRKQEKSTRLELVKLEETGHGDILPPHFIEWRKKGLPERIIKMQADSQPHKNGDELTEHPP